MRTSAALYVTWGALGLAGASAAADVTVATMTRGLEKLQGDRSVILVRLGDLRGKPAETGNTLDVGDEIRCAADDITIELICGDLASLQFNAPFRVIVRRPNDGDSDCAFDLLSGGVEVVTEEPTEITAGETTLGSKSTRYGMSVGRRDDKPETVVSVYEGEVNVGRATGVPQAVGSGRKLITGVDKPTVVPLEERDFVRAAQVFARIDFAKGAVSPESADRAYVELQKHYAQALRAPTDARAHLDLARVQLKYELPQGALYSLNRAKFPDRRSSAVTQFLRGAAFVQLNEREAAGDAYREARAIDPSVDDEATLRDFRIDPDFVRKFDFRSPRQEQLMMIAARVEPSEPKSGKPVRLIVSAFTNDRKPVRDAVITISATGGVFRDTNRREVQWKTDRAGACSGTWHCERCEGRFGFSIQASRPGFQNASSELSVTIGR